MPDPKIFVYGTTWCGDCRRVQRFLDMKKIPYQFVNVDLDNAGEQFVINTNRGMRSVPTILFEDGSILVEPSTSTLAQKLGIPA